MDKGIIRGGVGKLVVFRVPPNGVRPSYLCAASVSKNELEGSKRLSATKAPQGVDNDFGNHILLLVLVSIEYGGWKRRQTTESLDHSTVSLLAPSPLRVTVAVFAERAGQPSIVKNQPSRQARCHQTSGSGVQQSTRHGIAP
jgi:hypothetical protein